MEDPVVLLERNRYGHPLSGLLWERQYEKILLQHGWEKVPNWECLFVHSEKRHPHLRDLDDLKFAGKKHHIDPMWNALNKECIVEKPTSFLYHVHLRCAQRQCEKSKDIADNYKAMFFLRGKLKNYHTRKILVFFVVQRCGRSCQEMCATILCIGKQDDTTTPQK